MGDPVTVEVETEHRGSGVAVLQRPLRAVSVGQHDQTVRAQRRLCGDPVQLLVGHDARIPDQKPPQPAVQDARAIHAHQHTVAGAVGRMVHMDERVDAGGRVMARGIDDAVHDSRCPRRRRSLPGVQDAQRKRVVRLIAGAVADRCAFLHAERSSGVGRDTAHGGE